MTYDKILELEKKFGNSFYLFKESVFRQNISSFLNSFQTIYSNTSIGYSYKTNYLPRACKIAYELGAYAEIVSPMELQIAKKLNIPGNKVLYNGPIKDKSSIYYCLKNGAKINIDNSRDFEIISKYACQNKDQQIKVGVRLNFNLGDGEFSRFGYDVNGSEVNYLINQISQFNNIRLAGLHFHSTRTNKSTASYRNRLERLYRFYQEHNLQNIEYLDVGGGFYGPMDENIESQFDDYVPNYQEYAEAIAGQMVEFFPKENVELILEPGLALTVNILDFYTKVIAVKKIRDQKIVNTSGSFYNVKPSGHKKNLTMEVFSTVKHEDTDKDVLIAGYTCLENDYLYEGYSGKAIKKNDYLCFRNIGAYTIVFKPPFIKLASPIIMKNGSSFKIVRDKEKFQDIFKAYEF